MKFKSAIFSVLIAILCVFALLTQTACKSVNVSPVVIALDGVALASTTAIGIVAAMELSGQVSPVVGQVVIDYAKWAGERANKTIDMWQVPGPLQPKIAAAIEIWKDLPVVPPNLSAGLSAAIQTIIAAVDQFKHLLASQQQVVANAHLTAAQSSQVGADVSVGLKDAKRDFAKLQKKIAEVEKPKGHKHFDIETNKWQ